MKTVSLSGSPRENVGKKDAKKLRKEGFVPCVIYGGENQIHFSMDERNFNKFLFTPETFLISIEIEGKEYQTILQDIQYHPVTDKVLHADFLLVSDNKPVKLYIPVNLIGTAPGVVSGGVLKRKKRKIRVMGLIKDMPDFIDIDISELNIGDTILIGDLSLDNITMLHQDRELVVGVGVTRMAALAEDEEEEEEGEEGAEGEGGEGAEGGEAKPEGGDAEKPAE